MTRVPAHLDATPFREGRDAFAALLAEIGARGWRVEHEHDQPYFGPVWIVAPHGEFCGHGFGRADSLRLAMDAAASPEPASTGAPPRRSGSQAGG